MISDTAEEEAKNAKFHSMLVIQSYLHRTKVSSTELSYITNWFTNNNLILNMKKAKTEFVLYGTHQKLAKARKVNISLNGTVIE